MIIFAKNAEPLPATADLLEEGVAYWGQYTDAYVASGVGAVSFLESAAFNKCRICVKLFRSTKTMDVRRLTGFCAHRR
jgi:hypothetical protein